MSDPEVSLPLSSISPIFRIRGSALQSESSHSDSLPLPQMASSSIDNYLRTYRKRSGLTQGEMAFLLGCKDAGQVSRYERRRRLPTLRTALACASILRVPLEKLFAGVQQEVDREASERFPKLRLDLEAKITQGRKAKPARQKLYWLTAEGPDYSIDKKSK
jgi:transcriptional regulator with XRE-family HTH domain